MKLSPQHANFLRCPLREKISFSRKLFFIHELDMALFSITKVEGNAIRR